jgi:hypothetical protein
MPTELGDCWLSPKCIEVQPQMLANGGKALDGLEGKKPIDSNQTRNAISLESGSETARDKPRRQEGNSPDHQLRSPSTG